jgi:hypothetical protein
MLVLNYCYYTIETFFYFILFLNFLAYYYKKMKVVSCRFNLERDTSKCSSHELSPNAYRSTTNTY